MHQQFFFLIFVDLIKGQKVFNDILLVYNRIWLLLLTKAIDKSETLITENTAFE